MPTTTVPTSSLLVVFSAPVSEREQDFNDWYTQVHIRDVMRIPGSVAVQRFVLGDLQAAAARPAGPDGARYLAIYELADTGKNIEVHLDECFTDRMPISDALDVAKAQDTFYEPADPALSAIDAYAAAAADGVLLIGFDAHPGREGECAAWYRNAWRSILASVPGLADGHVYTLSRQQLVPGNPRRFLGIYRPSDWTRAAPALSQTLLQRLQDSPIDPASCEIAHYRAVTPRLIAAEVLASHPEQQALETRARAALGTRTHRFSLRELRKQHGMTA